MKYTDTKATTEDAKSSLKFDDILINIGDFGRYQKRIYFLICLVGISFGCTNLSQVFLAKPADHWCAVEEWKSDIDECMELRSNKDEYYMCMYKFRNASIPIEMEDEVCIYSQCQKYDANYTAWYSGYFASDTTNDTIPCDEGWNHDVFEYKRSIITDFDLVCDQKTLVEFAQSIYFAGVLFGSFFFGWLSDLVGRRMGLTLAAIFSAIFQAATALAPAFWTYATFRFFVGACNISCFLLAFVIGTELVGPSKRVFTGIIIQCYCPVGTVLLTFLGYFIRDWRFLQVAIMSLIVLFWFLLPFIPESTRWLLAKKKYESAKVSIEKMAEENKTSEKLPSDYMIRLQTSFDEDSREEELWSWVGREFYSLLAYTKCGLITACIESKEDSETTPSFVDLFRTPGLRMTTLNLMYSWFINSLVFYGLSLSTSDLGSNFYVSFLLIGLVEVPGYLICIPAIESPLGRRYSTSLFELLGGVACMATTILPLGAWKTSVAMIGKFGISASFALVYIYAAECFPTPLRSIGVGMCSTASRIGGILSPLILLLDEVWEPLPLLIFGSSAIIGGLLILFLPETRGMDLPETIEEAELFNKGCNKTREENRDSETLASDFVVSEQVNPAFEDDQSV